MLRFANQGIADGRNVWAARRMRERERRAVYRPAKSLRFRRVNKRRRDKSAEAERAGGSF